MKTKWVSIEAVKTFHHMMLVEHGGLSGVRDSAGLESALARPKNLQLYEHPSLCDLGASYTYGITSNHPFVDGNKRTAFLTGVTFLYINGIQLTAPEPNAVSIMLQLSSGEIEEKDMSAWYKSYHVIR